MAIKIPARKVGTVMALAYRDKDGDFMHTFEVPVELLTTDDPGLMLIRGPFNFTAKRGFIDKKE